MTVYHFPEQMYHYHHVRTLEELIPYSPWVAPSIAIMREQMKQDPGHSEDHLLRVAKLALQLAPKGDKDILLPAAILHDLFNAPKHDIELRRTASAISADMAVNFMQETFPFKDSDHERAVFHAIHAHSWSAGINPDTLEAQAVQDADRLESLGAIGLLRLFSVGGGMGRKMFHPTDPLCINRAPEELVYSADHFFVKINRLQTTMRTPNGKVLAKMRTDYMISILKEMEGEAHGDIGSGLDMDALQLSPEEEAKLAESLAQNVGVEAYLQEKGYQPPVKEEPTAEEVAKPTVEAPSINAIQAQIADHSLIAIENEEFSKSPIHTDLQEAPVSVPATSVPGIESMSVINSHGVDVTDQVKVTVNNPGLSIVPVTEAVTVPEPVPAKPAPAIKPSMGFDWSTFK